MNVEKLPPVPRSVMTTPESGPAPGAASTKAAVDSWLAMSEAVRNGTPLLLRFKDEIPARPDMQCWSGMVIVGRNRGGVADWCFAAPVGMGGFPDDWFVGWKPVPL